MKQDTTGKTSLVPVLTSGGEAPPICLVSASLHSKSEPLEDCETVLYKVR